MDLIDIRGLTEREFEEFRIWTKEKRDHYTRLLSKIERSYSGFAQTDLMAEQEKKDSGVQAKSEILAQIVSVMDNRKWMKNQQIRDALKEKHKLSLSRGRLRDYLTKNEDIHFKRKGKKAGTQWKLIQSR